MNAYLLIAAGALLAFVCIGVGILIDRTNDARSRWTQW